MSQYYNLLQQLLLLLLHPFNGLSPAQSWHQILMKPEMMGWQWHQLENMQSSAPHSRLIIMPVPHHSDFFTGRMPVVCKLLDLGHAGLGHAELGQRDWDSFYSVKMGKIVVCV